MRADRCRSFRPSKPQRVVQQGAQLHQRRHIGDGRTRHPHQTANNAIEHPGRQVPPAIAIIPTDRAAENVPTRPLPRLAHPHQASPPGMKGIQDLPFAEFVGVVSSSSTTTAECTRRWDISILVDGGWNLSPGQTKILMLTHRVVANEQGYSSLPGVFRFNEAFTKKEHPHIAYLVDVLDPACEAYSARKFGAMFELLGSSVPFVRGHGDKSVWAKAMDEVVAIRETGTVGQIVDHLRRTGRPRLPDAVDDLERRLLDFDRGGGEPLPPALEEVEKLRKVPYQEITALRKYLEGHSPFETKHGVKGAEFENVLVVIGRGGGTVTILARCWSLPARDSIPAMKVEAFERNRNLFYVACSNRPKRRLAVLFTQKLSAAAVRTLTAWFGQDVVESLASEELSRCRWRPRYRADPA